MSLIGKCPPQILRGVIDDDHLNDMRERNRARAAELINRMGAAFCCHPNYKPRPLRGDTTTTTRTQ